MKSAVEVREVRPDTAPIAGETPPMEKRAFAVQVIGRVQGVGFRAWTERRALRLGLDGWVANHADGSVRAVIAGPGEAVQEMIAAFHQGPPQARVDQVITEPTAPGSVPAGFTIRD